MHDNSKANSGWEVVSSGKAQKSKSKPLQTNNGSSAGNSGSAMKQIKVEELVSNLDSKYALLDPQLRAQAKREALGQQPPAEKPKAKAQAPAPAKDAAKKKTKDANKENKPKAPKSLPEAVNQVNVSEFSQVISTVKARFSNSSLFWLKELTSYLNNNLNVESDPVFAGKPRDYPSSLLSSELKQLITSTIKECDDEAKEAFYIQSLITMPTDMNRGLHVNGTKIVLQLLSFHQPRLALSSLASVKNTLPTIESRIPVTLSLLWVLSQPSVRDSCVGIKVWMEVMLPLINMKNYSSFVIQAAGHLTEKGFPPSGDGLSVHDYFKLREQIANMPANARQTVLELLEATTPSLIASDSHKMFVQLLRHLTSNRPDECRMLVECLEADPKHCYEAWCKEYRHHLPASSQLLQWISDNGWPSKSRDSLKNTLLHFRSINESFTPGKNPSEALKNCTRICESLIRTVDQKKKKSSSRLKRFNYLLLIALVSLVYYDIRVHGQGQFDRSRLGEFLDRNGVTEKALQAYGHARPYVEQARGNLVDLKEAIRRKGEELYPGIWAEMDDKYQKALEVAREQYAIAYEKAALYADLALKESAVYMSRFKEWSAVYRQQAYVYAEQAVVIGSQYLQLARQFAIDVYNDDRVQNALEYTKDMYHKAMHAIGICTH